MTKGEVRLFNLRVGDAVQLTNGDYAIIVDWMRSGIRCPFVHCSRGASALSHARIQPQDKVVPLWELRNKVHLKSLILRLHKIRDLTLGPSNIPFIS